MSNFSVTSQDQIAPFISRGVYHHGHCNSTARVVPRSTQPSPSWDGKISISFRSE